MKILVYAFTNTAFQKISNIILVKCIVDSRIIQVPFFRVLFVRKVSAILLSASRQSWCSGRRLVQILFANYGIVSKFWLCRFLDMVCCEESVAGKAHSETFGFVRILGLFVFLWSLSVVIAEPASRRQSSLGSRFSGMFASYEFVVEFGFDCFLNLVCSCLCKASATNGARSISEFWVCL